MMLLKKLIQEIIRVR